MTAASAESSALEAGETPPARASPPDRLAALAWRALAPAPQRSVVSQTALQLSVEDILDGRELAAWFQATYGVKVQRACRLAQSSRTSWYRRSTAQGQGPLRLRIRELAHARPRFGAQRIWVLLRREGWLVNRTRVRRLYRLEGLQLRMRVRRRKHIALHRGPAPLPVGPTERWSMDFIHDALADGRQFRVLTVVDQWSRHSPI